MGRRRHFSSARRAAAFARGDPGPTRRFAIAATDGRPFAGDLARRHRGRTISSQSLNLVRRSRIGLGSSARRNPPMHRPLFLFALALLPAVAGAECRYAADRNFDVPASGLSTIAFDLGSNDVDLEGVDGLAQVEVRGRACASDAKWLDALTVDQRRSGDTLTITPHAGHDLHGNWNGSNYAYVDLHVRVPSRLAAQLRGDSGDADVRHVASLDFETSSGDLVVSRVPGTVGIAVSSGDVRGDDLGIVEVRRTSSGDITLRDVHGPVDVTRSGSGDLRFDTVGSARIGSVGSGDIWVSDAAGDVSVDSVGSGDVSVDGVAGNFHVGSRGSGDIQHRNVRGTVSVPRDDD
jgi:putative autotransporter adhesin-like protein